MEFNTSKFPLNKQILYGTDDGVIYEEEKSGLMETWDALSAQYSLKMNKENVKQTSKIRFDKILRDVKVEVDTFMSVIGLVDKNIIKSSPIRKRERKAVNFKACMIDSSIKILDKGIEALEKANDKVDAIDRVLFEGLEGTRDLKRFGVPIKTVQGQLRIYFTEDEFAYVDSNNNIVYPSDRKPLGLRIILKYNENTFSTVISPTDHNNVILNIKEYFKECKLIGKKSKQGLSFEILRNLQSLQFIAPKTCVEKELDSLARDILKIVENKKSVERLEDDDFSFINVSISNIFVKSLMSSLQTYKIIPLSDTILQDDLPQDFVLVSDKIYKFKRKMFKFSFFVNEGQNMLNF